MAIFAKTADGWTEIGASGSGDCDLVGGVAGWAAIESVTGAADLQDLKDAGIAPDTADPDLECEGTYNITQDGVVWRVAVFTGDGSVSTSDGLVDALLVGGGSYRTSVPRFCSGRVNQGLLPVSGLHNIQVGQGQQTQSATWGSGSAISGVNEQGPVPYPPTGGFVGTGTGPNQGVLSSITGTEVNYAAHSLGTPGGSTATNGSPGLDGIVIVRSPKDATQPWEPAPELPGIGGWATITGVTGTYSPRYEYADADGVEWVAYEWTDSGAVTFSDGIVDVLCASTTFGGQPIGGRINRGLVTTSSGTHNIKIGKYSGPSWQEKVSEVTGVMTSGCPIRPWDSNELGGPGAWSSGSGPDAWSGISYNITGRPVLYCHYQGSTPGSFAQNGTAIIRVPKEYAQNVQETFHGWDSFALVTDGVVTDVKRLPDNEPHTLDAEWVACSSEVSLGWDYADGEFSAPPAAEMPDEPDGA
jgi:hypothetical protein